MCKLARTEGVLMVDGKPVPSDTAILMCSQGVTTFACTNGIIRFASAKSVKHILRVKEWDDGYIVVDVVADKPREDYIDIVPSLEELYIDPKKFLCEIKKVEVVA